MDLRGTDWVNSVIADLKAEKKLSDKRRKAMATKFAELGRYTEEARDVLRAYAGSLQC